MEQSGDVVDFDMVVRVTIVIFRVKWLDGRRVVLVAHLNLYKCDDIDLMFFVSMFDVYYKVAMVLDHNT